MIKEYVVITVIIGFITHVVHHKCNAFNNVGYKLLQSKNESRYCIPCNEEFSPFCHIEKKKSNITKSLSKLSTSLVKLMNLLNNFTDKTRDYDENLPK